MRANLFHNEAIGVSVMVHGDDYIAVELEDKLKDAQNISEHKYKINTERLGQGGNNKRQIRI